ncbi:MAG: hypothetical protein NTZ16_16170, partial [Verrucomicrobia bacterium]|nr:hypothetical protein [Verrucomicrobiota bacterium]
MNPDPDFPQEFPLMPIPEYDVVSFDLDARRWTNELPDAMAKEWSRRLPPGYVPRPYAGITSGSERSVMRNTSNEPNAVPRPDLNMPFDQVALRPQSNTLYYFTGGLTASYDVARRRWSDLRPVHTPPPVTGGSLAYDPLHDEFILFGGGHVAEPGPNGRPRGYTGTWAFSVAQNDWRPLRLAVEPPPRMVTRLVTDTKRNLLILFGGDGQSHFLADTWIFDLASRTWRQSKAPTGPPPRAGHFTVFDAATGLVFAGGGNNRTDLTDLWAYDPAADTWRAANGTVPTGFYLTADLDTQRHAIVLLTNNRPPNDPLDCNLLFPVRTPYPFPPAESSLFSAAPATHPEAMPKRPPVSPRAGTNLLANLPANQWVPLLNPGRNAPSRTWGGATFDSTGERILYWGGGHCGYEGSDVDYYDVNTHTWISEPTPPSYPERLWNHGVRPAGVTFRGEPWMDHGRRIYAYDPVANRMILVKGILLTTGYDPAWIRSFQKSSFQPPDALVTPQSGQHRWATWNYDLKTRKWNIIAPAPPGLDTLLSTPLGVMAVRVYWRGRDNDSGYHLPFRPSDPPEDHGLYLFRNNRWDRLDAAPGPGRPTPQNLYELTSLAFDTKRNQVILHGGGLKRNELWTFDLATKQWANRKPSGPMPGASREAVYLPGPDVFLTYGNGSLTEYNPSTNAWRKLAIPVPATRAGQNSAMVYDAKRDLILLVLGLGGNDGQASV